MKLFIISGNFREANEYMRRFPINPGEWFYVDSKLALMGIEGQCILVYGTYYKRSDWEELRVLASTRCCVIAEVVQ